MVNAGIIVNAAGAWADMVAKCLRVSPLGIQPMRRTMAVLPVPPELDVARWPLISDSAEGWYAKPEAGRLQVSPDDEDPVEAHDAFVDDMVLAEGLYRFEQAMDFPVTRVETSWAGLRSFAPDRTPVAGFDRTAEGFFWLAGQGGYGIQTSPALSRLAGQLIRRASVARRPRGPRIRAFTEPLPQLNSQTRSFITGEDPMTIRRIEAGPRMTQAVIHGNTVYLAGQVGAGNNVAEQTRDILAKVDRLLKAAGSDKSKLLQAIIWLADMKDFAEMNSVWDKWVDPQNTPARATGEAKLAGPEYKVEIIITAAV